MISLFEHIEYLLTRTDCVIIPDWGALITHRVPARFDEEKVIPPMRIVSFNSSITHNDGLLASSLARRHEISYSEAVKLIGDNVTVFRSQLLKYSEMPFGRIGFFHRSNDLLEFHPFANKKRYDDFYALAPMELVSLNAVEVDGGDVSVGEDSLKARFLRSGARLGHIVASVAVLVVLTLILTTPIAVNEREQNYASLSVPMASGPKAAHVQTQLAEPVVEASDIEESQKPKVDDSINKTFKYHLIISAWKTPEQAQLFVNQYPELNLSIYEKGGNYLICAAQSDDYSELVQHMNTLPVQFRDSWIAD